MSGSERLTRARVLVDRLLFGLVLDQMAEALGLPMDAEIEHMLSRARDLSATVTAVRAALPGEVTP